MFLLIWTTLLFSVRGASTYTYSDASDWGKEFCQSGTYCVTLVEGRITAEAGLCVVIPCTFSTSYYFRPTDIVWYKCDPKNRQCEDSDIIYSTSDSEIQSGFKGRVVLLEPDVRHENCSIMINDLSKSDSGSYQLRVNGIYNRKLDKFVFFQRTTVTVRGLSQKPTVTIPPLTEGQQTTLTCTAPGLCSGSPPEITWMLKGKGQKDSDLPGNTTELHTESLTAVTKRHSSALTFNPSAENHNMKITCRISFTGNLTKKDTVTLNVSYVKEVKITGDSRVKEGGTLNVSCSVESFPPSAVRWTKLGSGANGFNQTEEEGISSLYISNVTVNVSGLYICTAKHEDKTLTREMNITVTYKREPQIVGNTSVKEGDDLNLTCSLDSFPPSLIMWTKHSAGGIHLHSDTGSATLFISNVTAEDSGRYTCTAKHLEETVTRNADVSVSWFSKILSGSGCVRQPEVLTCVCISEGFPLPTITWPLLKEHTEYHVITTVSNHTVNSSVTIKHQGNNSVECFSSNQKGEATEKLTIQHDLSEKQDQLKNTKTIFWFEVIVAFLTGVLLSSTFCCLVMKCCRRNKMNSENLDETLEMMTGQDDPPMNKGQVVHDNHNHVQEGTENGSVATEKVVPESSCKPEDVEYASIDFSKLKKRSSRKAAKTQEKRVTEYAEIKIGVKEERNGNVEKEDGKLDDKEEELMDNDKEIKEGVSERQRGQVEAVYSTVKEVMGEV